MKMKMVIYTISREIEMIHPLFLDEGLKQLTKYRPI
jgi:hypothetical protein